MNLVLCQVVAGAVGVNTPPKQRAEENPQYLPVVEEVEPGSSRDRPRQENQEVRTPRPSAPRLGSAPAK